MKYYELDKEEEKLLQSYDAGEWKSVPDKEKVLQKLKAAARSTLNRNKSINIRISERDLLKIKAKAVQEGIPYQTLITSVLHKFGNRV